MIFCGEERKSTGHAVAPIVSLYVAAQPEEWA